MERHSVESSSQSFIVVRYMCETRHFFQSATVGAKVSQKQTASNLPWPSARATGTMELCQCGLHAPALLTLLHSMMVHSSRSLLFRVQVAAMATVAMVAETAGAASQDPLPRRALEGPEDCPTRSKSPKVPPKATQNHTRAQHI